MCLNAIPDSLIARFEKVHREALESVPMAPVTGVARLTGLVASDYSRCASPGPRFLSHFSSHCGVGEAMPVC